MASCGVNQAQVRWVPIKIPRSQLSSQIPTSLTHSLSLASNHCAPHPTALLQFPTSSNPCAPQQVTAMYAPQAKTTSYNPYATSVYPQLSIPQTTTVSYVQASNPCQQQQTVSYVTPQQTVSYQQASNPCGQRATTTMTSRCSGGSLSAPNPVNPCNPRSHVSGYVGAGTNSPSASGMDYCCQAAFMGDPRCGMEPVAIPVQLVQQSCPPPVQTVQLVQTVQACPPPVQPVQMVQACPPTTTAYQC